METLTVGPGGELTLPAEFLLRHGMKPEHPIRVIETKGGFCSYRLAKNQ
jgi:hypothetical protein